jgi:hypothetical protein
MTLPMNLPLMSPAGMDAERRLLLRNPNWDAPERDESPWRSRRVHLGRSGFWTHSEGDVGTFCVLLPVCHPADYQPYDVIAWEPQKPSRLWRQTGLADILGDCDVRAVQLAEQRDILLVETPAEWLVAAAPACCILDWRCDLRRVLRDVAVIRCSTADLARRLDRQLDRQVKHRFHIRVGGHR